MKRKITAWLLVLAMVLALFPAAAFAADVVDGGACGENLTWTLDSDGLLTISGTGDMESYYTQSDTPWFDNPQEIRHLVIEEGCTSISYIAFQGYPYLIDVKIPSTVNRIGYAAFGSCVNLMRIDVAASNESFTSINGALYNKDATELIAYPGGKDTLDLADSVISIANGACRECNSLTEATLPEGIIAVGTWGLSYCQNLASLTIPGSLEVIENGAFIYLPSLTKLVLKDGVTTIDSSAFSGCPALVDVTIPDSVTSIGAMAFYGAKDLKEITIPASVTEIGDSAFGHYYESGEKKVDGFTIRGYKGTAAEDYATENGFSFVDLGGSEPSGIVDSGTCGENLTWTLDSDGLLTISGTGYMTDFSSQSRVPWDEDREDIKRVVIQAGVASIGNYAFQDTPNLISVEIPASVKAINDRTFTLCGSLTRIDVAADNAYYTSVNGALYNKSVTELIAYPGGKTTLDLAASATVIHSWACLGSNGLTSVAIPEGITEIGDGAFALCQNITSVTIPGSMETIMNQAFSSCTSLKTVEIKDGLQVIGYEVFSDCTSLDDVTIPDSVTDIQIHAFFNCPSLKVVTVPASVTEIETQALGYYRDGSAKKLEGFTIRGYKGTAAEAYATENGFNFVDLGGSVEPPDTKLPAVTDLTWGVEYSGPADALWYDARVAGAISWKVPAGVPEGFETELLLYRVGESGPLFGQRGIHSAELSSAYYQYVDISDAISDAGSGRYYVTIQLLDGSGAYENSEIATSGVWEYTAPAAQVTYSGTPYWDGSVASAPLTGADAHVVGLDMEFGVAYQPDGEPRMFLSISGGRYQLEKGGIFEDLQMFFDGGQGRGPGYYFFRVRPISEDITQYRYGEWTDWSEGKYFDAPGEPFGPDDPPIDPGAYTPNVERPVIDGFELRLAEVTSRETGEVTSTQEITREYWPNGVLKTYISASVSGPFSSSVEEHYDEEGNFISGRSTFTVDGVTTTEEIDPNNYAPDFQYEYDEEGRVVRMTTDRLDWLFVYDEDGNMIARSLYEDGEIYLREELSYYADGSVYTSDEEYYVDGELIETSSYIYTYDADGRLSEYTLEISDLPYSFLVIYGYSADSSDELVAVKATLLRVEDGVETPLSDTYLEYVPLPKPVDPPVDLVHVDAVAATCEEDGNLEYWTDGTKYYSDADGKNEISLAATVIPATGHSWGAWEVVIEPTEEDEGLRQRVCRNDPDHVEYEIIPALGTNDNPFVDVDESQYYFEPVLWAVENGITNGISATKFGPDNTCTRAQVVTFLWRAKGAPEPASANNPFVDVPENAYYYKAVLWAVENGITNGTSADHFSPDLGCTRAQVVTFLWRTEQKPAPDSGENPFVDVPANLYYTDAVLWAVENGITNGVDKTHFGPDNTCTRGQIVTFLYRDLT